LRRSQNTRGEGPTNGVIPAHLQDAIWVTGVLVFALVFLWYAREALRDNDSVLAFIASTAAAGFVVAAGAYVWWLW
jgi:hypothetical protein